MAKKPIHTEELVELYVLGSLPADEALEMEARAMNDPALLAEIDALRATVEQWAVQDGRKPAARVFEGLMGRVSEIEAGRGADEPPFLNAGSKAEDYVRWTAGLRDEVMAVPEDLYCRKIGKSEDTVTFLVKMSSSIPVETHTDEIERFLILEGNCEFQVGPKRYVLGPGDQFTIPLHVQHTGWLTGADPCLFICQRTKVTG
jgi:mannose-6-phosphate isomerase-like protein (cupin superfamily)